MSIILDISSRKRDYISRDDKSCFMGIILEILITVTFLVLGFVTLSNSKWTLMVCNGQLTNGRCNEDKYVLTGYKSKNNCMEKGIALENSSGFACGRGCKESSYGYRVCKEICTLRGCVK